MREFADVSDVRLSLHCVAWDVRLLCVLRCFLSLAAFVHACSTVCGLRACRDWRR